jgi:hypothetical protein
LPPYKGAEVRYTLDGSDPFNSKTVKVWDGSPFKGNGSKFRARTYLDGQPGPLHIGARLSAVGKWNTAMVTEEFTEKEFNMTGVLDEPGVWLLGFRKTRCRDHLIVKRVDILIDGKIAASDTHDGGSGVRYKYRLNVETAVPAGAKVTAKVSLKGAKRENKAIQTEGELTLEKSEWITP